MMKNYEVDIYEKTLHGRKGKLHYMGMILNDSSIERVKLFALEVLAGMTFEEAFKDVGFCYALKYASENNKNVDDMIGYELAEKLFAVQANVLR